VIHVEGNLNGEFIRSSTRTRSWSRAEAAVKKAERLGGWIVNEEVSGDSEASPAPTIKIAIDSYIAKLKSKS